MSGLCEDQPGWAQTVEASCPILSSATHCVEPWKSGDVGRVGLSSKEVGLGPGDAWEWDQARCLGASCHGLVRGWAVAQSS